MATPVKAITYLPGIFPWATTLLPVQPLALAPRKGVVLKVAPPLWRPVRYLAAQPRARTILVPGRLLFQAMAGLRLAIFWRNGDAMPLKGQRHPLTR